MEKVNCMFCKKLMDCPQKMLAAKNHICEDCINQIGEKNTKNPKLKNFLKEMKNQFKNIDKNFEKCDEISRHLKDTEFKHFLRENDTKTLSKKETAEKAFIEGSFSTLAFIALGGMEESFFDDMLKTIKEAKLHKQKEV